jgi:hypothetical protein
MQTVGTSSRKGNGLVSAVGAVLVRPQLWPIAVVQAWRLVPRQWWRHSPFLPLPPRDYMEFRLMTQYGGGHGVPRDSIRGSDLVDYLQWCKQSGRL